MHNSQIYCKDCQFLNKYSSQCKKFKENVVLNKDFVEEKCKSCEEEITKTNVFINEIVKDLKPKERIRELEIELIKLKSQFPESEQKLKEENESLKRINKVITEENIRLEKSIEKYREMLDLMS